MSKHLNLIYIPVKYLCTFNKKLLTLYPQGRLSSYSIRTRIISA